MYNSKAYCKIKIIKSQTKRRKKEFIHLKHLEILFILFLCLPPFSCLIYIFVKKT